MKKHFEILKETFGITNEELFNLFTGFTLIATDFDLDQQKIQSASEKLREILSPVSQKVITVSASTIREFSLNIGEFVNELNEEKRKLTEIVKSELLKEGFTEKQSEDIAFAFYRFPNGIKNISMKSSGIGLKGDISSLLKLDKIKGIDGDVLDLIKVAFKELILWSKDIITYWYESYTPEQISRKVKQIREEYLKEVKIFGAKNALELAKERMNNFI